MEMEGGGGIFLDSDSEPCGGVVGGAGQKTKRGKMVKGDSDSVGVEVGAAQKKMLADITNLHQQQQRLQPFNQQAKQQSAPLVTADQLLNENAMLMKLLANRNAIIESCKAELQKSQSNFQKLRKQNSDLALANTQMLAELNSSRQRLRELQHQLGSKNGILKAMKLELTEKENTAKLKAEIDAHEVGASQIKQSDETFQDNKEGAKRKRVSKSHSSAHAVIKQVKSTEKVDNQRCCLRRQSARFKAEKPGITKDFSEVDGIKYDVSHLQENLANENGPTSLGSKVHEAREDTGSSGPINTEQVHAKKNIEKRQSLRRQSARFKAEKPGPKEDFFEVDEIKYDVSHLQENLANETGPTSLGSKVHEEAREDTESSGPTNTEQVHAKKNIEKKRHSLRRQSATFTIENPEPTEDSFQLDDANFAISHLCDNISERSHPTTSSVTSGQENVENNSCRINPQEIRRSSVGRPLRRTVEKVMSYKEVPLNVKMRRS